MWSSHYDEDSGEVYYYNRLTKKSVWEKPSNFDGYDIKSGQGANSKTESLYSRTFGGVQMTEMPSVFEAKGP